MRITRFEDIEAWQVGRRLAQEIHDACLERPFARDFALRDQINRASGSIMDNIAEGFDAGSHPEFIRFLGYSQRSCAEVQSQLYRALDRHYITQIQFDHLYALVAEASAKTGGFIRYLKSQKKPAAPTKRKEK